LTDVCLRFDPRLRFATLSANDILNQINHAANIN
jgi:hypothetical protein